MQPPKKQYDIILWGCSGYTGRLVALVAAKRYGLMNPQMRFALAGRSEAKLRQTAELMLEESMKSSNANIRQRAVELREACEKTPDTSIIPMIILPGYGVDEKTTNDMTADMVRRASVVIATAGPYSQYGEPIIKACANNGVDYVDCTGEYRWVKDMYQKYNDKAKETKAKILPFCGFAYLLNDIGLAELQRHSQHLGYVPISEVEQFAKVSGASVSYGTLSTVLINLAETPLCSMLHISPDSAYEMCNDIPTTSNIILKANRDRIALPWYSNLNKSYMTSTPLGKGATRYVHWTNEIKEYAYGPNFIYQTGEPHTSILGTFVHYLMFLFALLFLKTATVVSPLMWCVKKFIANESKHATVTSLEPFENPANKVRFITQGQIQQKNEEKPIIVEHEITFQNGEAYLLTAYSLLDTAVACLKSTKQSTSKKENWGFGPPSHLLKNHIVDTMKQSNFNLAFKIK